MVKKDGRKCKAVWSSCTVNCGSRCLLRLHVKDDTG
ncbi:hypothetical protein OHF13_25150, partial [Escherichia coli]|nr:hypothetical protein [Escherichia coli]